MALFEGLMGMFGGGGGGAAGGGGGALGSLGTIFQGAGAGVQIGSALGQIFGGGKKTKKAVKAVDTAANQRAAHALRNSEMRAQAATKNANAAALDAANVEFLAKGERADVRRAARRQAGAQIAAGAASGAVVDAPVMDMVRETFVDFARDEAAVQLRADAQFRSLRQQAEDEIQAAEIARIEGKLEAESIMAEAARQRQALKQARKKEKVGGFGGLLKGVAGAVSLFGSMGGGGGAGGGAQGLMGLFK